MANNSDIIPLSYYFPSPVKIYRGDSYENSKICCESAIN